MTQKQTPKNKPIFENPMDHNNDIPAVPDRRLLDIDPDIEWARFRAAAGISETKTIKLARYWKAAAAIVLVAGAGLLWRSQLTKPKAETIIADAQAIEATVETSTQISLNRNSKMTCTDNRKNGAFNVYLEGEAYFDVEKNPGRTFTIDTKDVTVTVRGTSFDVCENGGSTTITVTSGNVEVKSHATDQTTQNLTRGKQLVCRPDGTMEVKTVDNFNCIAWKLHRLEFDDQTVDDIMRQLQAAYGIKYRIADPTAKAARLKATFDQQDITAVFNVMSQALDIEIAQDNDGTWVIGR